MGIDCTHPLPHVCGDGGTEGIVGNMVFQPYTTFSSTRTLVVARAPGEVKDPHGP